MFVDASAKYAPRDWLRDSVLQSNAKAYATYLAEHGYADNTVRHYLNSVGHFSNWLTREEVDLGDIDDALVHHFLTKHLKTCDCSAPCQRSPESVRPALGHLLQVLRSEGCIPRRASSNISAIQEELNGFDKYLDRVCGLAPTTRTNRLHYVRAFLRNRFGHRPIEFTRLKPSDVLQFVFQHSQEGQLGAVKVICSSLRSYLRFRALGGDRTETLIAVVPTVAQWRLASVPKTLMRGEIKHFLRAFDCTTAGGQRDYAMARCLVDLGLRAKEVTRIQLEDFNWHEGTLQIRAKGGRVDLLPLPVKTGRAIAQYLRKGRPNCSSRALFVRHRAPVDAPITTNIVHWAMRCAYAKADLPKPWPGTHVLRHSIARGLLQAGASLKEIADILRHRSLNTTMIYTKVDLKRLVLVAMPWPRRMS
jgi:integrase/recombinase XerD